MRAGVKGPLLEVLEKRRQVEVAERKKREQEANAAGNSGNNL